MEAAAGVLAGYCTVGETLLPGEEEKAEAADAATKSHLAISIHPVE